MKPAHAEECPSGQRRGLAALGDDKCTIPGPDILPYNFSNPGTKMDTPRVDTAPQGVEAPTLLRDL